MMKRLLLVVAVLAIESISSAQQAEFRWLSRKADGALFKQVEAAFSDELKPDQAGTTGNVVPMTVKYVARVGIFGDTELVLVGYKENNEDRYPIFKGFTFHPGSRDKVVICGMKGNEWLSLWKFKGIAHFQDKQTPDVVFRYFSCTECEAEELLASFRYDVGSKSWKLRHWSEEDGDDLMIGSDNQFGDEGVYSYECLHTVRDLTNDGLDDVAVRCRESVEAEKGKRVTKDETLLYTIRQGAFVRTVVRRTDPMNAGIQAALCQTAPKSPLCGER